MQNILPRFELANIYPVHSIFLFFFVNSHFEIRRKTLHSSATDCGVYFFESREGQSLFIAATRMSAPLSQTQFACTSTELSTMPYHFHSLTRPLPSRPFPKGG